MKHHTNIPQRAYTVNDWLSLNIEIRLEKWVRDWCPIEPYHTNYWLTHNDSLVWFQDGVSTHIWEQRKEPLQDLTVRDSKTTWNWSHFSGTLPIFQSRLTESKPSKGPNTRHSSSMSINPLRDHILNHNMCDWESIDYNKIVVLGSTSTDTTTETMVSVGI